MRANPPTSRPAPSPAGAQRQHLAGVRVGRARLGVQVVAVVPDDDQARGRATGANIAARVPTTARDLAAADRAASAGSARPGRGRRSATTCRPAPSSAVSAASTRATSRASGTHDQRAPAGGQRRWPTSAGELVRPGRAGQRRPDRARGARRACERVEERGAAGVAGPAAGRRPGRRRAAGAAPRRLGLDPGVPGRDGEPQHVGQRAGVAVGDRPGQPQRPRASAPAPARPTLARKASRPGVLGCRRPARARSRRRAGRRTGPAPGTPGCAASARSAGHQVVERPVEVRQRRRRPRPGRPAASAAGSGAAAAAAARPRARSSRSSASCSGSVAAGAPTSRRRRPRPDRDAAPRADASRQRRRPRRTPARGRRAGQAPAAALRASTRSVRSQVKSGSSRPKWPYAAVCA